jgi:hypothetical protein
MVGISEPRHQSTDAPECSADDHQFEFFDSFPGHEIDECRKCGLRKFRNLQTGELTYSGRDVAAK